MRHRQIIYLASAEGDLDKISDWLVDEASESVALRFLTRIRAKISTLSLGLERGSIRPGPQGIRVIGIAKTVSIAFVVTDEAVVVHRVLYGGQNWESS